MNPLTLPWKLIAEVVAFAALCAAIAFGIHRFLEHERDIGREEVRAEYQAQLLKAKEDADAKEAAHAKQLKEAQDALTQANDTIRNLTNANSSLSLGLRDQSKGISDRLPSLTADALRDIARTYGDIFTSCQTEFGRMVSEAERLNAEKRALIDAWPK
jgi:methylphosphotriester-DNA--protein-cysteine methyltransferase